MSRKKVEKNLARWFRALHGACYIGLVGQNGTVGTGQGLESPPERGPVTGDEADNLNTYTHDPYRRHPMIPKYSEASREEEMHSALHKIVTFDADVIDGIEYEAGSEEVCECDFIATVQARYDFASSHNVRLDTNAHTSRSNPVWMTPNRARYLASLLIQAANDADQLNKDFPIN
jgi:hypothetical protein